MQVLHSINYNFRSIYYHIHDVISHIKVREIRNGAQIR
jgi:hypothetical protein